MRKPAKVVMLPTEKATGIWTNNDIIFDWECHNKYPSIPQHLYLTSDEDIKEGDWCMFYNQLSKVLEINGKTAQIETQTIMSKEDAKFINDVKGKELYKEGDFGRMKHGFSISQLPKVIATTDKSLLIEHPENKDLNWWLPQIPQSFVKAYVKAEGKINEVQVEYTFRTLAVAGVYESAWVTEYYVKTREDNTVIIHKAKENMYNQEQMRMNLQYCVALFAAEQGLTDTAEKMKIVNEWTDKWIEENL